MHKRIYLCLLSLTALACWTACRPTQPVPKPKGYFKVDLPQKAYQTFDSASFPYTFEYPVYGVITKEASFSNKEENPYWINIYVPKLDATIYVSYKAITSNEPLDKLIEDSYRLSYAHDVKADYIKSPEFTTPNGLTGIFYNVGGNAASAYQFFVSDGQKHFMRASLYFNVAPNSDSLKPAAEFLKEDMQHLIKTLKFK